MDDDKKRVLKTFSLSPEILEALRIHSEETDIPQSRIIERALRMFLGLTKQTNPEDKP